MKLQSIRRKSPLALLLFGILLLFSFFLSGCNPVVKLLYDVKDPAVENQQTLISYLNKKVIPTENVVTLTFEAFEPTLKLIDNTIPEVMIFDKEGHFIPYGEEDACNAPAFDVLEQLRPDTAWSTRSPPAWSRSPLDWLTGRGSPTR